MADTHDVEVGKSSEEAHAGSKAHEQPPPEGSLRSFLRKSSDYTRDAQRIYSRIDSYQKSRRYVHLQLNDMYSNLCKLYASAFATQWTHFKRTGDAISAQGSSAADEQKLMAQIYVSHWILDLYCSVRDCVSRLSSVACNEAFPNELSSNSNEYDAYLVALNAAIRPTHIVGYHEDVMFIPRFPDDSNFNSTDNPFVIPEFAVNYNSFKMILSAIKDKRAGWKTAYISTDVVGRPTWLFDWFRSDLACAWFPTEGNFNAVDVAHAYILGVACTPKLAHTDDDSWQSIPPGTDEHAIDISKIARVRQREVHADFEVDHYSIHEEKFTTYIADSDFSGDGRPTRKRPRSSHDERDKTTPGYSASSSSDADYINEEIIARFICLRTYLYFSRVIQSDDEKDRQNALLSIIVDPMQHCSV